MTGAVAATETRQRAAPFDVILRGGTVIDGTGARPFRADVGILRGRILTVGDLAGARSALEVDVAGLSVAPGFINLHSHASASALAHAENMLTQGVTTEILNPDGGGPIDLAEQLARLGAQGLAVNAGAYIGFNSAWQSVIGPADRRPSGEDIGRMRAIIAGGLAAGAWGVSAGLDYKPAYFATTDEVIDVVKVAGASRTNFTNHDRLTPETNFSSRVGIAETIRIGEAAGLLPVVTHMKVQGHEQGTAGDALQMLQQSTRRGHYAAADAYPYLAGQTSLAALVIPGWAQDGGREAMLKRFADPVLRARIAGEAEQAMKARFGGAEGVYLPAMRRELVDVMKDEGAPAGEAVVRILEKQSTGAILRFGAEADLVKILQHPATSIACDCGASAGTSTHPRYYGSYPRVLGQYVRERKVLTWENAVRKMTGLPASTIGLVDRGFLAPGMAADVTVFDPRTVIDRATYDEPALPSEGIRHVLVNGTFAIRDGRVTGEQGGRVLRRAAHMPSRPMSLDVARRASVRGTVEAAEAPSQNGGAPETVQIAVDVTQSAGANRAKGSFRLSDRRSRTVIEMTDLGLLQTAAGWMSFTGRGRLVPSREERLVTVVIDWAGRQGGDGRATVIVEAEDAYQLTGTLEASRVQVR
jgi:N-acyl-D-aspartate/D-glutamate deacylase